KVDQAGGLFLDIDVDVNLVGRTGHWRGGDIDFVEVAQAVDTVARGLDAAGVVPCRLVLAHFTAHDLVARSRVAADLNAAHINAAARVYVKRKIGLVLFPVEHRIGIDVGKGVAQASQIIGNGLDRGIAL